MVAAGKALSGDEQDAVDILMFGGEGYNNDGPLNDLWILRIYPETISKSNPGNKTNVRFLSCLSDQNGGSRNNKPDFGSDANFNIPVPDSHVILSTLSFTILPIASTAWRFGHESTWAKIICGILILVSYVTASWGFAVIYRYLDEINMSHFSSAHGMLGFMLLILTYCIIPIFVLVSIMVNKIFPSRATSLSGNHKNGNYKDDNTLKTRGNDSNNSKERGSIRDKLTSLLQRKKEYSFEVNRATGVNNSNNNNNNSNNNNNNSNNNTNNSNNSNNYHNNISNNRTFKQSNNNDSWLEQRKSITDYNNYSTNRASPSHNRLDSNATYINYSNNNNSNNNNDDGDRNNNSYVIATRTHDILFQTVLILMEIYLLYYLFKSQTINKPFAWLFVIFILIVYIIWFVLAWVGYPKGENSLLVNMMVRISGRTSKIDDDENRRDEDDNDREDSMRRVSIRSDLSQGGHFRTSVIGGIREEDEDEEARQAELEKEIHGRDVVVMTIPKRRLTVVNG